MAYLLIDTNIVSYLYKDDSRKNLYTPLLQNQQLVISIITFSELIFWADTRQWGTARKQQLTHYIYENYSILPIAQKELAQVWVNVSLERQKAGRPITAHDAWIAATAIYHKLPLMTHNTKDFEGITNLQLITQSE